MLQPAFHRMLSQSHGKHGDGYGQCHDDNQHGDVVMAAHCRYTHSTLVGSQVSMIFEKTAAKVKKDLAAV